jgi:hypothetical protein
MKSKYIMVLFILLFLYSCEKNYFTAPKVGDFLPLSVGWQWTYKITESETDISKINFPKRLTVSVVGELIVSDQKYFLVENYFVPGPYLPDTILVRVSDNQVFMRFNSEQEEYLFYSFTPTDSTWSIPMHVNPETLYPYKAELTALSDQTATIDWNLRGGSRWQEIHRRGEGRIRIVSVSHGYGKIVWDLEK